MNSTNWDMVMKETCRNCNYAQKIHIFKCRMFFSWSKDENDCANWEGVMESRVVKDKARYSMYSVPACGNCSYSALIYDDFCEKKREWNRERYYENRKCDNWKAVPE